LKLLAALFFATISTWAASDKVDVYSAQDLQAISQSLAQKGAPFASKPLEKYGSSHYTMVAHREATGSAEVHEKEADVFLVVDGDASIVTGGKLVSPHTEKAGELRATSIDGGEHHPLTRNSVIHIPAGVPHQLLIEKGKPFTYFVVKVIEQ
jgi:mannose-6-phosphate isomerase-like protein (cupin superfamily)